MKAIDLILPEPKTELELHERWKNRMQSELTSLNRYRKTIEVVDQDAVDFWSATHSDPKADAEHARLEDEAIQDGTV